MTMVQRQIDRLLAQRASEWVEILKTAGPAEREAFVDWLRESRRHVEEFLQVVAIDQELNQLDMQGHFDQDALLRRVSAAVTPLPLPPTDGTSGVTKSRPVIRRWAAALVAGLAVVLVSLLFVGDSIVPAQHFVTASGVRQSIELQDGSVVQLNADSHVRVRMHRSTRELELLRGEALFKVAHDSHRPFRVHAGNAMVQALGTQFNVSTQSTGTVVSVVEGKVRVSSDGEAPGSGPLASNETSNAPPVSVAALTAGQQAVIKPSGTITRNEGADVQQTLTWQPQRLVFRKTALEDVVRQFNSHNVTPKLRLIGIDPGSHHYSATFDADDPQSFGDLLEKEPDLVVERRSGEILIRRR